MSVDMGTIHTLHDRCDYLKNVFNGDVKVTDVERLSIYINYSISMIDAEFSKGTVEYFEEKNELNSMRGLLLSYKDKLRRIQAKATSNSSFSAAQSNSSFSTAQSNIVKPDKDDKSSDAIVGKVFTILGILGIVGACVTFFYAYWESMPKWLQFLLIAAVGVCLIITGYKLVKKTNDSFYSCIVCSGIAVLYVGISFAIAFVMTTSATFITDIERLYSLIYMMVLSLGTPIISFRVAKSLNSKLVLVASLIGVYASVYIIYTLFGLNVGLLLSVAVALFVGVCLLKSDDKTLNITAQILNYINVIYLVTVFKEELYVDIYTDTYDFGAYFLCWSVTLFLILIHVVTPCLRAFKKNKSLGTSDVVLMVLNAVVFIFTTIALSSKSESDLCLVSTLLVGLVYLIMSYKLSSVNLLTEGCSTAITLTGILLLILTPLFAISGYTCLIWICLTAILLYLWGITDKKVFNYSACCLLIMLIFTHNCCEDATFQFWVDNGNYVTEILSLALFAYVAYALRVKKNDTMGLQICYGISLLSIYYVVSEFIDLIKDVWVSDTWSTAIVDQTDILNYIGVLLCCCFLLFIIKYADCVKNKALNICLLIINSFWSLTLLTVGVFYAEAGLYQIDSQKFVTFGDSIIALIEVGLPVIISTLLSIYMFMFAINNLKKGAISDRVVRFILTVTASIMLVVNTIKAFDLISLYSCVVCVVLGAVWVVQGFKLHFKGMRYTGLAVISIFLIKLLLNMGDVPDDAKPVVYILVALSCFSVGWVYTYLSKKEKNEEVCIDD